MTSSSFPLLYSVTVVTWIGSTTGGILTDKSHEKFSKASEGKLVYPVSMILLVPICTLGFGLSFSFGLPAQVYFLFI